MSADGSTWEFVRTTLTAPGVSAAYGYFVDGATPGLHRGLPSRHLTFIISMDAPVETAESPEAVRQHRLVGNEVILGGLHTAPAYVYQPARQRGVQLAVHPLAARRLFGVRAADLTDLAHEGENVLGTAVRSLRDRMHELPTWRGRLAAIDEFLTERALRADGEPGPRWEVAAAWAWLTENRGSGTIAELARETTMSSRQLSTLFARELGIGPKTVSNLMRFDHALAALGARVRAGAPVNLADIADGCGYYDQSHLAREFHRFTGTSASGFLAEEFRNIQAGGHQPATE